MVRLLSIREIKGVKGLNQPDNPPTTHAPLRYTSILNDKGMKVYGN